MAVPDFLNTSYRYLESTGITDVATIITDLRSELVTNGSWTEPTAGTFLSDTDGLGFKIQIVTSRVSQTRCQLHYQDMNANSILDGRIDIDASNNVRYYTGPYHCSVDSIRGTPEGGFGGIICMSPQVITSSFRGYAKTPRNSAGTLANAWTSTTAAQTTGGLATSNFHSYTDRPAGTISPVMFSGAYFVEPLVISSGSWMGMLYQHVIVPSALAAGAEISIEVDTGTNYVFKVLSCSATNNRKIAARKG